MKPVIIIAIAFVFLFVPLGIDEVYGVSDVENKLEIYGISLEYTSVGGTIFEGIPDSDGKSIIFVTEFLNDGVVNLALPRHLIDATLSGFDIDFVVLVNEVKVNFDESKNSEVRVLTIPVVVGTTDIEVIGTTIAPPPIDADGDGVPDYCPKPDVHELLLDDLYYYKDSNGMPVLDKIGCPKFIEPNDRDKDGILDYRDSCPDVFGIIQNSSKTMGCPYKMSNQAIMLEGTTELIYYLMRFDQTLSGFETNTDTNSLILSINAPFADTLFLTIPRNVMDSTNNGEDKNFLVLINGKEADFEETTASPTERKLRIPYHEGISEIEIIGTFIIPEFNEVVLLILVASIVFVVALSKKFKIMNDYWLISK